MPERPPDPVLERATNRWMAWGFGIMILMVMAFPVYRFYEPSNREAARTAQLADLASAAKPFMAVLDPDDPSFLAPGDMPTRIVAYCKRTGQQAPNSPGEFVRVCLESLALTYRQTLRRIEECTGRKAEVIHIVGGGSQNKHLNQWAADATGCTVVAGPIEATAAGNIAVQAVATGIFKDIWAAREVVRRSFDVAVFQPADTQRWDAPYKHFEQLRA